MGDQKKIGRPCLGNSPVTKAEIGLRHRLKFEKKGGAAFTIRIQDERLVRRLGELAKESNAKSKTALLTRLVEASLDDRRRNT